MGTASTSFLFCLWVVPIHVYTFFYIHFILMADLDSLSCSVMFLANAAAVSTINVTKPRMYQPNIKVMFNRVNQH